jgi:hypothetical protein
MIPIGDVGELDYSALDETNKPTLRIIDRVANMTELYVDGDSVWVEQVPSPFPQFLLRTFVLIFLIFI